MAEINDKEALTLILNTIIDAWGRTNKLLKEDSARDDSQYKDVAVAGHKLYMTFLLELLDPIYNNGMLDALHDYTNDRTSYWNIICAMDDRHGLPKSL